MAVGPCEVFSKTNHVRHAFKFIEWIDEKLKDPLYVDQASIWEKDYFGVKLLLCNDISDEALRIIRAQYYHAGWDKVECEVRRDPDSKDALAIIKLMCERQQAEEYRSIAETEADQILKVFAQS